MCPTGEEDSFTARATKHLLSFVDDVAIVPGGRALVHYVVQISATDGAGRQSAYFAHFAHCTHLPGKMGSFAGS